VLSFKANTMKPTLQHFLEKIKHWGLLDRKKLIGTTYITIHLTSLPLLAQCTSKPSHISTLNNILFTYYKLHAQSLWKFAIIIFCIVHSCLLLFAVVILSLALLQWVKSTVSAPLHFTSFHLVKPLLPVDLYKDLAICHGLELYLLLHSIQFLFPSKSNAFPLPKSVSVFL
jgi:hypothetical protein